MLLNELMQDPYFVQREMERRKAEEEEERTVKLAHDFDNDRTSMDEFDMEIVKKIISTAIRKSPKLESQGNEMLQTWENDLHSEMYLDNDEFNKLYKQFEQLKDSNDTPLIQFNKLYSLTKELTDAAEEFDSWKDSDEANT